MRRGVAAACVLLAACAPPDLPPYGEALVVVDTDLPVPRVVSRLRIDTYAADGRWLESRDVARPDIRDWPASFSVQAADDAYDRELLVRLRVYGGSTRDARAEGPRLVRDGKDETPETEPAAERTVDRLIRLRLRPGVRGRVRIVARASCAGAPARMDPARWESCIDREGVLDPVTESLLEPELVTPSETLAGSAGRSPCPTTPARRDAVCVEGGAFVLGTDDVETVPDPDLPPSPMRVLRLSTFLLDRYEVTVARYREALARGFVPPQAPEIREGPIGKDVGETCAFSEEPRGREDFAMSCVTWETARAFCMFSDGDLPTEAEWEYAASSAGRRGKAEFPWGDDPPRCEQASFGRLTLAGIDGPCEAAYGSGPEPIFLDGALLHPGDSSIGGVQGLAGGVAEWTRDRAAPYSSSCWATTSVDPSCDDPRYPGHALRGGAWASTAFSMRTSARAATSKPAGFIGFRCRYPAEGDR